MPVDKFGRYNRQNKTRGETVVLPQRRLLDVTPEGDLNVRAKRLRNLAEPVDDADAATKKFVLARVKEISDARKQTETFYTSRIDPKLIELNNGLSKLRPLVASYTEGQIPSVGDITTELNKHKLAYEGTLKQATDLVTQDLRTRVEALEKQLNNNVTPATTTRGQQQQHQQERKRHIKTKINGGTS